MIEDAVVVTAVAVASLSWDAAAAAVADDYSAAVAVVVVEEIDAAAVVVAAAAAEFAVVDKSAATWSVFAALEEVFVCMTCPLWVAAV